VPPGWRGRQRRNPRGGRWLLHPNWSTGIVAENRHQGRHVASVDYRRSHGEDARASTPVLVEEVAAAPVFRDERIHAVWSMKPRVVWDPVAFKLAHHGARVQLSPPERRRHLASTRKWMPCLGGTAIQPRALHGECLQQLAVLAAPLRNRPGVWQLKPPVMSRA